MLDALIDIGYRVSYKRFQILGQFEVSGNLSFRVIVKLTVTLLLVENKRAKLFWKVGRVEMVYSESGSGRL